MTHANRFGIVIVVSSLAAIGVLTLGPTPGTYGSPPWWCLTCGDTAIVDTILNIALFVPFGFGLRLSGLRQRVAFGVVAATTLAIECLQFQVIVGRDASLRDLVANFIGGGAGWWVADLLPSMISPGRPRRLALWSAGVWAAVMLAAALLLQPQLPRRAGPATCGSFGQPKCFPGVLDRLVLTTPVEASQRDITRLNTVVPLAPRSARLEAILRDVHFSDEESLIAGLNQQSSSGFLLLQSGADLAILVRTRGAALTFQTISLVVPRALESRAARNSSQSASTRVVAQVTNGRISGSAEAGGADRTSIMELDPTLGWMLLAPNGLRPDAGARVTLTVIWLVALTVPGAWWWGLSVRRSWELLYAPTFAVAALAAAGWIAAVPQPGALGWLTVILSALGATAASHVLRERLLRIERATTVT